MGWLDLHMHSDKSDDGQYTPGELTSICLESGVKTAAIADHNSTGGIADALKWAGLLGIVLIPAVELDCTFREVNLHVLGYWIDYRHPVFQQIEDDIALQEQKAAEERIDKVKQLGIYVDLDGALRLANKGIVTGEVIAESALQQKENDGNPLLEPYRQKGKRGDNPYVNFYWDFCAQGKPAYVPVRYISLPEAIDVIRAAGGIAVLAHPGINVKEDSSLLHVIAKQGISGLEAYSSYHSREQTAYYREQALKLNLAVSCGSDFHGKTKPKIKVGSVDCGGMESELLAGLIEKRAAKKG